MLTRIIIKWSQWHETQKENSAFYTGPVDKGSLSYLLLRSVTGS